MSRVELLSPPHTCPACGVNLAIEGFPYVHVTDEGVQCEWEWEPHTCDTVSWRCLVCKQPVMCCDDATMWCGFDCHQECVTAMIEAGDMPGYADW